jgi:hypothetical protein
MKPMSQNQTDDDAPLREELVAYLDGELSAAESRRVEQRAAAQPDARRMLEEFDRTWHLLDELETPATGEDFTRTTLEMVALAAVDDAAKLKAETPRRRFRAALWGLAGLAAAALIGFLLVQKLLPDPSAALLRDLSLLENYDEYREVGSIDFLRALSDSNLFSKDSHATAPAIRMVGNETVSQARKRLEAMSADQSEDLFHNEQVFRALNPEEQKRIRALHAAIQSDPERNKLLAVMNRYCKWFEEQPPYRRGELQVKTPKERIEEIRKQVETPTFHGNEIRLDDRNRQALARWMDRYTTTHEADPEFLFQGPRAGIGNPAPGMPRGMVPSGGLRATPIGENSPAGGIKLTPQMQHRAVRAMLYRRWKSGNPAIDPRVSEEEMADLRASLSSEIRERLDDRSAAEQAQIIAGWLRETASSELDERLAEYLESLSGEQRDGLMSLPSDEMYKKLDEMYRAHLGWQARPGEPGYYDQPRWGDGSWTHRPRSGSPRGSGSFPWMGGPGNRQPHPDQERKSIPGSSSTTPTSDKSGK